MLASIISTLNKLLFFSLLSVSMLLLDFYVFQGFKTIARDWNEKFRITLFFTYWGFTTIVLLFMLAKGFTDYQWVKEGTLHVLNGIVFIVYFGKLLMAIPLLIEDIARAIIWLFSLFESNATETASAAKQGISRKKFISWAGAFIGGIPTAALTYGIVAGAHNYRVRKKTLRFSNLPEAFTGFKIVQLSDIHSGSFWDKNAVIKGVEKVLSLKPDVILFTGDLVNNKATEMREYTEVFSKLKAPYGVYSVLGNHDYGDYVAWNSQAEKDDNLLSLIQLQKEMGWDLLMNESRILERNGQSIAIVGIENWSAKGRFPKYGKMEEAVKNTERVPFKILLSHDPSHWRAQVIKEYKDIDLMFAGHTHGMQFGIETANFKWSPVKYMYPEWAGLYTEGKQNLYVNRGFGYLGYPGRFGIDPEITLIELQKE